MDGCPKVLESGIGIPVPGRRNTLTRDQNKPVLRVFSGFRGDFRSRDRGYAKTGKMTLDRGETEESRGHIGDMSDGNFSRVLGMARPGIGRLRASVRVEIRAERAGNGGM